MTNDNKHIITIIARKLQFVKTNFEKRKSRKIVFYLTKNRNRVIILNIGRNSKKSKCWRKNIDTYP